MYNKSIRPINITTDLKAIADLLYLCFADSMDADGEKYINYLRRVSQPSFLPGIAKRKPQNNPLPGEGFVYEEKGKIVGNITLSPIQFQRECVYLISNVAVDPEHRGKQIATKLTQTALDYIESKGIRQTWLQVKGENQAAINLYEHLGFSTFMVRTTWGGEKMYSDNRMESLNPTRLRRRIDWEIQKELFEMLHPPELAASYGFEIGAFRPTFKNIIKDFIRNRIRIHWATEIEGQSGFASYDLFPYQSYTNLWLAIPEKDADAFIATFIPFLKKRLGTEIRVNFPVDIGKESFLQSGMQELDTLVWKRKYLT